MKNVLYTGNFSIGWEYFNGLQRWQIYSLYNLQKYCERHNIELRVIDNSHTGISSFHSWLIQKSQWSVDNWSIGTMTAIFAQEDFLKSDFDNFAWIDLDVLINKTSLNLFDFVQKEKVVIEYSKRPECDLKHLLRKKRFLLDFLRIRPDIHCTTGFYLMDRALAQEASSYRTQLGLNPFNDRWNDIIEYFNKSKYFITEETIMDALLNVDLPKSQLPPELLIEILDAKLNFKNQSPFAYHFASEAKTLFTNDDYTMELNYYAPINQLGYGQAGINFALNLDRAGVDLSIFPIGEPTPNPKDLDFILRNLGSVKDYDPYAPCLKIWHQNDLFDFIGKGKHIGFPIFELDRFKPEEIISMKHCDEIFVCSEWAKNILSNSKIGPAKVVPLGFNPDIFKPAQMLGGPTRFFNAGKWEKRKGHDFLLHCFNKAFSPKDNVELHMLSHNPFPHGKSEIWEQMYRNSKLASKIRLLPRQATQENVYYIMKQVDCGVFPARAEGWNLELLEVMACGKHVIATNYSGHTEFCTKDSCRFIDITALETASDGIWFNGFGYWASLEQEQEEQLINHLREVHRLKQENGKLEQNHAGILQASKFTWEKSTSKLLKAIYDDRISNTPGTT